MDKKSEELLPYLYETVYKNHFILKFCSYKQMLDDINIIKDEHKKEEIIKYCLKVRIPVIYVTSIFKDIYKLEELGVGYSDKKYDRYYNSVIKYKDNLSNKIKEFQTLSSNPDVLNPLLDLLNNKEDMLIPIEKPIYSIYKAIKKYEEISNTKQDFLKLFDRVQISNNKELNFLIKFEEEYLSKKLGF